MDGHQVSVLCLLLEMIVIGRNTASCPPCQPGFFLVQNCSLRSGGGGVGIRCQPCTDCSATHEETEVECSKFSDSVCRNQTTSAMTATSAGPPVSPHDTWLILSVISFSVFLILLLSLSLALLACRKQHGNKHPGLNVP
ncbi:tumor necrosis factor receptor superfamily member 19-like [Acanthochromis polyacanthus]|uniref:tumor necrosis factor receptor superfamily member 19-like n=1 Tax=Acanthochromis polyacanthus TaxID=80966 RepID=UPI0022348DC0|nr:tumor necrosis factor receptor superfamily member 19-like [Acanthochromis polyacanthus]